MTHRWLAERMDTFDSSGIRKAFEMAGKIEHPIDLSIGQPDFDVPEPIKEAAIEAIRSGHNGYSVTQGTAALRERLQERVDRELGHDDRQVIVTSGSSGGLTLALMSMINPGDEVIIFDPYFVMYPALVNVAGGRVVLVDTYPDFRLDPEAVRQAISPRTKAIMLNSPSNPTGATASSEEVRAVAQIAADAGVALLSDEIYSVFSYDEPAVSPAVYNPETIVLDALSKSYGMTGWRVGFAHGPRAVIESMLKLQQYTFVCSPHPLQCGAAVALDISMEAHVDAYRRKRDLMYDGLRERFEISRPGGAFYLYPRAPDGSGMEFVKRAIARDVLMIPGNVFSQRDTHFRISYAADDATLERGIEVLCDLAK